MARLFNAYVIVDWSAAESKATGKNSIWIGVLKRDVRFRFAFEAHNPATRREAETLITTILDDRAKHRERTLIGFDFAFGYPRGFAAALGLPGEEPWKAVWDLLAKEVSDKPDNMNNRFQVGAKLNRLLTGGPFPFWGSTPKYAFPISLSYGPAGPKFVPSNTSVLSESSIRRTFACAKQETIRKRKSRRVRIPDSLLDPLGFCKWHNRRRL